MCVCLSVCFACIKRVSQCLTLTTIGIRSNEIELLPDEMMKHEANALTMQRCLTRCLYQCAHSHSHTLSLSLVLVVMMKSKELKTQISLTHSLILFHYQCVTMSLTVSLTARACASLYVDVLSL